jgi:hypothetical protein
MASRPNSNDRQAGKASQSSQRQKARISEKENKDVDEMSSPRTPIIYEIVRRLSNGRPGLEHPFDKASQVFSAFNDSALRLQQMLNQRTFDCRVVRLKLDSRIEVVRTQ